MTGMAPDYDATEALEAFGLTDKQLVFCQIYMQELNANKALKAAGYCQNSRGLGKRLLTSPKIKRALKWLREKHSAKAEITMDVIRAKHLDIYDKAIAVGDLTNANRAVEGLGKTIGAYTDRVHFDGPPQVTIKRDIKPNDAIEAEFDEIPDIPALS